MRLLLLISILYLASQATSQELDAIEGAIAEEVDSLGNDDVNEVCYGDYGCFNNLPPYGQVPQRPIADLPESPEAINLFFTHYKRNLMGGAPIAVGNTKNFDPKLPTRIVSHGYTQANTVNWMIAIKNNTLKIADHNIILTNWDKGAAKVYTQSASSTRVVGAGIALLVQDLIRNAGADLSTFHLIGHSLGAHIVGYAGERLPGLPRITGLDPAGPLFIETDPVVRLDTTDAAFVDIIHTDSFNFGFAEALGHVDFFPNGGYKQPGCTNDTQKLQAMLEATDSSYLTGSDVLGCSHMYSCHIYADTILQGDSDCPYYGHICDSYDNYKDGKCFTCPQGGCNKMGFSVSETVQNGSLYLQTLAFPYLDNFCLSNYLVRLNSSMSTNYGRGEFALLLNTDAGNSLGILDNGETTFYTGASQTRIAPMPPVGNANINEIGIYYKRLLSGNVFVEDFFYKIFFEKRYNFTSVTLTSPEFVTTNWCPDGSEMINDEFQEMAFKAC